MYSCNLRANSQEWCVANTCVLRTVRNHVYLNGHNSHQSNISDTKNALHIPLAMCRLGRMGLLVRIGDTPPAPLGFIDQVIKYAQRESFNHRG